MNESVEARQLLVDLLHEAAQLEHCLLDSYLYTATTIKTLPQEFAAADGQENRRRAIHFERARAWKQSLLAVATEEMLHLHYVQCLLRALGEAPSFALPERDPVSGNWIIPNWRARIGSAGADAGKGVEIPLAPLNPTNAARFVLYESTDALQDADPFGPKATDLFERLHAFEVDLRFESMLFGISDDARRAELKAKLAELYTTLTPVPLPPEVEAIAAPPAAALPPVAELRFQSIADFYYRGILPLYEEAFDFGWVANSNIDLNDEQLDQSYAAEGFLPVGPIYRDKNFEASYERDVSDPLRHYKNVADIINEIVEEGEGAANFEPRAEAFLATVQQLGGTRAYLKGLVADPTPSPPWLDEGERLRESHLYRFAMLMVELRQELELAASSGVEFDPSRTPLQVAPVPALAKLVDELPAQFNACYLALVMWLSRMYEIRNWESDQPRRHAIEMLASWPLMSLAIRPFLELASFFPIDPRALFRLEPDALPLLPIHARQLRQLYDDPARSEATNERMDYLAMRVLSDAARWAAGQAEAVRDADLDENARQMILARLGGLAQLDEFERQYPYRVHGGYSDRMPDKRYQQEHPDAAAFEENPAFGAAFENALLLRLRFAGWGLVQLATDPDPPTDEAGCAGTHMLHSADGDRRLDRALVWQDSDPTHTIRREPRADLPALGVNCAQVSLVVTDGTASSGYSPLQIVQSSGAVQTSGVAQVLSVDGLNDLLTLTPQEILGDGRELRVDLLAKNGQKPFLNGYNHLVWQDGEPIDPFVLALFADAPAAGDGASPQLIFHREIFNQGLTLMQMNPLQRLESSRAPCGFDWDLSHIPDWARERLSDEERELIGRPGYPGSYLAQRASVLAGDLAARLGGGGDASRAAVDEIVSLAERMRLVSVPRHTTPVWLMILLHYGHTISGALTAGEADNPVFAAFADRLGLRLSLTESADRKAPNSRWLVAYTKGVMDTDALSDLVFGELYVPVAAEPTDSPISIAQPWSFPATMADAVRAYACTFAAPFWAPYEVSGDERRLTLADGTVLVETLASQGEDSYSYTTTGIDRVTDLRASFSLGAPDPGERVPLEWRSSFQAADAASVVSALTVIGRAASQMTAAMSTEFAPRLSAP